MDFDLVSISKDDGVDFKVSVTTYPEIEVGEYKGLKAEKAAVKVDAAEVNAEVNAMAERNARMVSVEDRAAADGDTVIIDFEGFVDGKAFDGGKAEGHSLVLGSGQFVPGFEEQIVGKNIGDEFDVNVTFPEDYGAKELAGKEALFKVKLHEIKVRELPKIDDEFAKDVSEFDTLKELKADLKKKALDRKKKAAEEAVENALVQQIVDSIKGEIRRLCLRTALTRALRNSLTGFRVRVLTLKPILNIQTRILTISRNPSVPRRRLRSSTDLLLKRLLSLRTLLPTKRKLRSSMRKWRKITA